MNQIILSCIMIIMACILMLFTSPLTFGATNCHVMEYVDRSEVICIGDEKAAPESNVPANPSRATIADYLAQNQTPSGTTMTETAPPAVKPAQPALPSGAAPHQTAAPPAKADTAADHLAKRRELATRNTRNLTNYTSVSTPPGQ